jgi:DNA-binding transcriptional ArsR family regulator
MLPSGEQSEAIFDALGNPVRRQILRRLGGGAVSVGDLAAAFTISRPAISRHLAVLQDAGLIAHQPAGTRNLYALDPRGLDATRAWLDQFWDEAESRLRLVAENLPRREDDADG